MVLLRRILVLVLFLGSLYIGLSFASANEQVVAVDLVFAKTPELPLWLALATAFATGAAVMAVLLTTRLVRGSLAQRRYRKTISRLEAEVHELRTLPVTGAEAPPVEAQAEASDASEGAAGGDATASSEGAPSLSDAALPTSGRSG